MFIQSDVMLFLKQDPQRDHATMLYYILKCVQPGGTVDFSNNLRGFIPMFDNLEASAIKDITTQTIPEDFRNKQIHHCYKISK